MAISLQLPVSRPSSPPLSPIIGKRGPMGSKGGRLALLALVATALVAVHRRTGFLSTQSLLSAPASHARSPVAPSSLCPAEGDLVEELLVAEADGSTSIPSRPLAPAGEPGDAQPGDQDFCPTDENGRPTVILVPLDGGTEPYGVDDPMRRTHFMSSSSSQNPLAPVSDLGFLPWRPQSDREAAERFPRRFATARPANQPCPVYYVPASSRPPILDSDPSSSIQFQAPENNDRQLPPPSQPCSDRTGITTPALRQWQAQGHVEMLFGFATTPSRALQFLPRWTEWLPSSLGPASSSSARSRARSLVPHRAHSSGVKAAIRARRLRRKAAGALVVVPPDPSTRDQAWLAVGAAAARGLDVRMKEVEAPRTEIRYFDMVRQLWWEGKQRQDETGVEVDWFVFADDDTYFLHLDEISHMLSEYDPNEEHFIGSLSESLGAINHFGRIAFGGAGVFVSKALMRRLNGPGVLDRCHESFSGTFGGDGLLSKCAAMVLERELNQVVTEKPGLHQLDFRGEGHGVFGAGWRFTSLHHWASWLQLQPRAHPHVIKDVGVLVSTLGSAARLVGPDNWTRRYVFGMPSPSDPDPSSLSAQPVDSAVVVALGYSVTTYGKGHLAPRDLAKVERTWDPAGTSIRPETRPALYETSQRKTYYLKEVKTAAPRKDTVGQDPQVAIMTHVNHNGELIDVVWDGRPRPRPQPASPAS